MTNTDSGAPSWLFSFVDLAFLMLIAMTQLADDTSSKAPDFGEMVIPRISAESAGEMPAEAADAWQLRIHPPVDDAPARFELIRGGVAAEGVASEHFASADMLRERLSSLEAASGPRPLLAPHEDARSQDLLDAAALIEELWPGRRRVTVARVFGS
jgi:hypothetical protein